MQTAIVQSSCLHSDEWPGPSILAAFDSGDIKTSEKGTLSSILVTKSMQLLVLL
ncbi:hypothetical protein IHE45_16G070400 [Dioscorea alata]|uniref:Uncharacterized protein n=1 Tax=Dioscorea alata TaxID=55571 RepID=A0ACB7UI43_DIOAL|nr:hypothetical protein IHE45_16G070400 [Dioscorea alata]